MSLSPEKAERIHKYYRTPKSVMRALEKASGHRASIGREVEPFAGEQILQWINAAAPLAASTLITQLRSDDESVAQHAAVRILEWSVGKPRAARADAEDPRSRVLFNIVVPEKAESFEDWIGKLNQPVLEQRD